MLPYVCAVVGQLLCRLVARLGREARVAELERAADRALWDANPEVARELGCNPAHQAAVAEMLNTKPGEIFELPPRPWWSAAMPGVCDICAARRSGLPHLHQRRPAPPLPPPDRIRDPGVLVR